MSPETAIALTVQSACLLSGCKRTKLFAAMSDGRLKARKFDGAILILRSDLEEFLNALPLRPADTSKAEAAAS